MANLNRIIRDHKAEMFIKLYACNEYKVLIKAYEKMNNVLIDDRRTKVEFSHSFIKLWNESKGTETTLTLLTK